MLNKTMLAEMINKLLMVDDQTWGLYAFSSERLDKYIKLDQKLDMIKKAANCGEFYARKIREENLTNDVKAICKKMRIDVKFTNSFNIGNRILFANYLPPDKIEIMEDPIKRANLLVLAEMPTLIEYFKQNVIIDTVLGHEIFHFIENEFAQMIYTRTEKVLLGKFLNFKNYSTIRTLGEIGAMAFTKEINGLNYSPFILDVLLYYSYNPDGARQIYDKILRIDFNN